MFRNIANEFEPEVKNIVILTGGDINSRIGNLIQSPTKHSFYRENPDKQVNSHGKFISEICNSFKCYPLNNLTYNGIEFDGKHTFYKANRKSQNDIVIGNLFALKMVKSYKIHEIGYNPSDHFPVVVNCKFSYRVEDFMNAAAVDLLSEGYSVSMKRDKKINYTEVNWDSYKHIATNELAMLHSSIVDMAKNPAQTSVDICVKKISASLYNTAKSCSISHPNSVTEEVNTPPFQHLLDEADRALSRHIKGEESSQHWHTARLLAVEETKKAQFGKISSKWSKLLAKSNSKDLWNEIDWKGDVDGSKVFHKTMPTSKDLAEHFLTKSDAHEPVDITTLPKDQYVEVLDQPITLQEMDVSAKKLKDKATADGWCPQMVQSIQTSVYPLVLILFNAILSFAIFPTNWCRTIVTALFKNKGIPSVSKFYRPVTLVQMLYKWFDFVLLERFKAWFIPADEQTAYRLLRSCADHIFLIRALISYAKKTGKKLFICAIDFDGAFDRVSRNILLKKLALFGAGSTFILCIAAMYAKTESIIIQKDNHCVYQLLSGIKQGLPLSPFLFLFYIDDIFSFFYGLFDTDSDEILEKLHLLIHADDANILASTRSALIEKIKGMIRYCKENKIILQLTKCMFIVINGSDEDKLSIPLDNENLPSTSEVLMLGSWLTETGSLSKDLQLHLRYRFKNIIKYFNFLRTNRYAPIAVKLNVLSSCVTSTILYNCETFGPELPKGIEVLYYKMIKCALNVRPSTPNMIVLIESGMLPLRALVNKRQLDFYRRLKESMAPNGVRRVVFDLLHLTENITKYIKHYTALNEKYENSNEIYSQAMSDVISKFREKAENSEKHYKFYIYTKINPDLVPSPFLSCPSADAITRFRCGSHNLPIETLRWARVPREERLCNKCHVLGDEMHFIFRCVDFPGYFENCNNDLSLIWQDKNVFDFFNKMSRTDYLKFKN